MDTRQMRWLLAVAEHKSFAKAADALGVSQPNLSNAMARLEDRLGGKLFLRTPMGSELTPFAESILPRITSVVAEIDEIRAEARLIAQGEHGVLRVGVGAMLPKPFAVKLASELVLAHPAAQFRFLVLERERILSDLQKRDLDVAICAEGEGLDDDQFATTRVLTSEIVALAAPTHPLAGHPSITEEEFYAHPHAGISIPAYGIENIIERPRRSPAVGRYESNAYHLLLPIVLGGAATLVAPAHVAAPLIEAGKLVQLNIRLSAFARFHVVVRKSLMPMPLIQSAVSTAESIGAQIERGALANNVAAWLS